MEEGDRHVGVREGVTAAGSRGWSDGTTGFEDDKESKHKECRQHLESGKGRETDFPLEIPEVKPC